MRWFYNPLVLPLLNERRLALGLVPVKDSVTHLFPAEHALVAADPELFPLPPDISSPQLGAFCLADERPLPPELERFLAAGEPLVYIGFGSMPDSDPERTTRLIAEAVRRVGCRVVLSSGWAELGATDLGPDFLAVGPLSHWRLFPRLAAAFHHAGAGTTAAAARAGVPRGGGPGGRAHPPARRPGGGHLAHHHRKEPLGAAGRESSLRGVPPCGGRYIVGMKIFNPLRPPAPSVLRSMKSLTDERPSPVVMAVWP